MVVVAVNDGYAGLVFQEKDGTKSLSVLVGGVHCALCIQKIESRLKSDGDVRDARLNFSTGRLNVRWDGEAAQADRYVQSLEELGYRVSPFNPDVEKNTQEAEDRFLLLCLGVAGFAMGNIMLLSVGLWSTDAAGMGMATRSLLHWISALIAIPTIIFSGRPFFKSAWQVLKKGHTNMDVPISLALILAGGMSLLETVYHGEHVYFDSAVMLIFFLLIGRYLDFRARRSARRAATDLMQTLSGFALVLDQGRTKRVLIRDLQEDMEVIVAAGEKIPVDGIIVRGESTIDTSLITGETLPRDVGAGQEVYAGTLNQSASLIVKVSKAAENSLLADIVRLMEKAEQGQAQYVRLADRAARLYTPVVHFLALCAFILWFGIWGASWQEALLVSVTVLIITCPCALGLAVPVVQVLATGLLMKRGVLVKSGDALERLACVDTIIFDKTGTLTTGHPDLMGTYEAEHLRLAASLASQSKHPLSMAVQNAYRGEVLGLDKVREYAGKGLEAEYQGKRVKLGKGTWCGDENGESGENIELWLSVDDQPVVCFIFEDQIKQDAQDIIRLLERQGFKIVLLSGDRKTVVDKVGHNIGIDMLYADQTPTEKHAVLENLKADGHTVLMVGDGLNDAPVLAGAHVSMAPGSAVDMAQNVADIIVMGDKLRPVYTSLMTAKASQMLVKQNFALAILYNFVAVPLAFAGLVTPMIAALAMSGSSLIVIANSYRLKWLS